MEKGAAVSKLCPSRGTVYLSTGSNIFAVHTNCKAWGCKSCRDRKLGHVASLIQYGLSMLDVSYLVTVTYAAPGRTYGIPERYVDATGVQKDWRELIRRLKKLPWWTNLNAMFRVVKLTRKGQIHLHIILGGTHQLKDACLPKDQRKWPTFKLNIARCECLTHQLSKIWWDITKDSYVTDAKLIYNIDGAAWYLVKYMRKGMYGRVREELDRRGFVRRYDTTRAWPRGLQMRRRGTIQKAWLGGTTFVPGHVSTWLVQSSKTKYLMEQMGTDMAHKFKLKGLQRRVTNLHEKIRHANNHQRL